jgi:hypothetical protein
MEQRRMDRGALEGVELEYEVQGAGGADSADPSGTLCRLVYAFVG